MRTEAELLYSLRAIAAIAALADGSDDDAEYAHRPLFGARSSRWPAVRAAHLIKHPTCAACGSTKCLEVHHIEPYFANPTRELDNENLITLCDVQGRNCHYCFGHAYNWHGANPYVAEDAARFLQRVKAASR